MSTKIFTHKPLGRAELRRLAEPPKPLEAYPGPSVRPQEASNFVQFASLRNSDAEREKRAQERLARRAAERKLADMIEAFTLHCQPVVIRGPTFLRWLIEGLEAATDRDAFIRDSNIITLPESISQCLVCGAPNPVVPAKSAFIVWPDVFLKEEASSIAAVACEKCCNLQARLFARQLARLVWGVPSSEEARAREIASRRMRKMTLLENDRDLLEWLGRPRPGNDERVVMRAVQSGTFEKVMRDVEDMIVEDARKIGNIENIIFDRLAKTINIR